MQHLQKALRTVGEAAARSSVEQALAARVARASAEELAAQASSQAGAALRDQTAAVMAATATATIENLGQRVTNLIPRLNLAAVGKKIESSISARTTRAEVAVEALRNSGDVITQAAEAAASEAASNSSIILNSIHQVSTALDNVRHTIDNIGTGIITTNVDLSEALSSIGEAVSESTKANVNLSTSLVNVDTTISEAAKATDILINSGNEITRSGLENIRGAVSQNKWAFLGAAAVVGIIIALKKPNKVCCNCNSFSEPQIDIGPALDFDSMKEKASDLVEIEFRKLQAKIQAETAAKLAEQTSTQLAEQTSTQLAVVNQPMVSNQVFTLTKTQLVLSLGGGAVVFIVISYTAWHFWKKTKSTSTNQY
jgi:hypothetical protein